MGYSVLSNIVEVLEEDNMSNKDRTESISIILNDYLMDTRVKREYIRLTETERGLVQHYLSTAVNTFIKYEQTSLVKEEARAKFIQEITRVCKGFEQSMQDEAIVPTIT